MADRDSKGRFVKDHQPLNNGKGGRHPRPVEERYLQALTKEVTLDDFKEITRRAVIDAKNGDAKAREWLSNYILGKPPQRVQHEGGDSPVTLLVEYVNDWHEEDTTTDAASGAAGDSE